jgi:hypothetical protein
MNNLTQPLSLPVRMLIGAAIGLAVISFFIFGSGGGNPAWGRFWMIKPLIITPFSGAMGGLCNYYILRYRWIIGANKTVAIIASVLVALVGLWMGIVLGLNGTMWN